MSSYHIGSVNATNVQIGDQTTQNNNTQVTIDDELAKLATAIDRHASLLPNPTAAHRALHALRVECAARPVDPRRVTRAAGELTAATAAAPAIRDEIAQLLGRIGR